jgi:hypothetical protein
MALHEILHDTRIKKKDGLMLKLDIEKAYDKLNWDFLFECLKQRGFGDKWCEWIKLVMVSRTVSVKVNNTNGCYFKSGRGVRQGDLFCLLFSSTLLLIPLQNMISLAKETI